MSAIGATPSTAAGQPSLAQRAARTIRHPLSRSLLVLTFTTGLVDAVSYLGIGHVLLVALAAILAAAVKVRANAVSGDAVIALLAFAMGVRNATIRRVSVPDLTT